MKILHLIFTGLGTKPVAPGDPGDTRKADCGMEATVNEVIRQHPEHTHVCAAFAWDGNGSPDANCRAILAKVQEEKPDRVYNYDHSFGNSLLNFLINWLSRWHEDDGFRIDLAFCFDPCHNYGLFGRLDWDITDTILVNGSYVRIVRKSFCFYNTDAMRCWGVVGTPFRGGENAIDVTDWTGPILAHVDEDSIFGTYTGIPNSDRIRQQYVFPAINSDLSRAA